MKRELAWRVFAGEFNDATLEIKSEETMTPSYVVTPLGARVNRLFIVGVLTDVETVSEGGEFVRAHVSDPTGVFTLYSGQYQQEVTEKLSTIEAPAFVAVVGKIRTFVPEEGGTLYVSVRPESITEVNAKVRDQWILETCWKTKERIEAVVEATRMTEPRVQELQKLGYSRVLARGVISALKHYGDVNVQKYIGMIQEALEYLTPKRKELPVIETEVEPTGETTLQIKDSVEVTGETEKETTDFEEIENKVLLIIKENEGEEGALWDTITEKCEKAGLGKDAIEEALTSLMDKGLIYEPVLGTLKTT